MDSGLDLGPVPHERRTASVLDVLLVFAGANIVTTTLVTGGSVGNAFSWPRTVLVIVIGTLAGVALLALLARLGPRFGLPTMVLLRQPFGDRGAEAISFLLLITNFAWIALNNVIAARAMAGIVPGSARLWSVLVGAVAVVVTLFGPRAMAIFNRGAVPLLLIVGIALTVAIVGGGSGKLDGPGDASLGLLAGLDVVIGYQVSWSLMFADYTRFQRAEGGAATAVFLGLALSSLWLIGSGRRRRPHRWRQRSDRDDPRRRPAHLGAAADGAVDHHHQLREPLPVGARRAQSVAPGTAATDGARWSAPSARCSVCCRPICSIGTRASWAGSAPASYRSPRSRWCTSSSCIAIPTIRGAAVVGRRDPRVVGRGRDLPGGRALRTAHRRDGPDAGRYRVVCTGCSDAQAGSTVPIAVHGPHRATRHIARRLPISAPSLRMASAP